MDRVCPPSLRTLLHLCATYSTTQSRTRYLASRKAPAWPIAPPTQTASRPFQNLQQGDKTACNTDVADKKDGPTHKGVKQLTIEQQHG